jgi:uncharacterized protein (TIGR02271 family)
MKTVVGLFDSFADARAVVQELESNGFSRDQISIVGRDSERTSSGSSSSDESDIGAGAAAGAGTGAVVGGAAGLLAGLAGLTIPVIGPALGAGWLAAAIAGAGVGAAAGGLVGALVNAGVPKEHAEYYSEGIKRGGTLVTVKADDARAEMAAEIMSRHNVVNLDERVSQWQGATGQAKTDTATARPAAAAGATREEKLEVVEEEMRVGKRAVAGGGVRVYAHVTEKPVEEQVNLRQERVDVERRPVDRPATGADVVAFKDETIEVTEMREEAVVQKEARVVEEIAVSKDVEQRTETVRDTVRRTEVDVEPAGAAATGAGSVGADDLSDEAIVVFVTGLGDQYRGRDWASSEADIRRSFEQRHTRPGLWDRLRDRIRRAFEGRRT